MNEQHIVDYLRARGQATPPVDFTLSVMAALDSAPAQGSRFSAYLPAFVAVGAAAIIAVLALLVGPGRDIGPAPDSSATPSATAEAATVDDLRVALMASVDVLRASPGVEGRQQAEIDGTIGTATWFDWRPNGDQVVVERWDLDVTETGWWMVPNGAPPATGQRIYTNIQAKVGDEFFFVAEGGDWQVAAPDDAGILALGPGMLDRSILPWYPLEGLAPSFPDPSESEARIERNDLPDGGVEWSLDYEWLGERMVQRWTIPPGGQLRSWTWEREGRSVDSEGDFIDNATRAWLQFTITDGDPIESPDVDAVPDAAFFGLPADFPLDPDQPEAEIDYRAYVEDALDVLEAYHWNSANIDWAAARSAALDGLPDDPTAAQAHQRISEAIQTFDFHTTAFVRPDDVPREGGIPGGDPSVPTGDRLGDMGYVSLAPVGSTGTDALRDYLAAARTAMMEVEAPGPACGWIVDPRDYDGGAWGPPMWALGGLLGEGRVVTFSSAAAEWALEVTPEGAVTVDGFDGGDTPVQSPYIDTSFEADPDDETIQTVEEELPYVPSVADPPIAVLVGNGTVSGGEQTLVAFLGRPDTRVFGGPTGGSPIVTPNLEMSDGARLRIPIWVPVDRQGTRYTTNILPDEVVGDTRATGTDAILDAAVEWLERQPGCS